MKQNPFLIAGIVGVILVSFITLGSIVKNLPSTSDVGTVAVAVDGEAPSIPLNLRGNVLSGNEIMIGWSASTDNVGVAGYHIYRAAYPGTSIRIASVQGTIYNDTGLDPLTVYEYKLSSYDAAGNESLKPSLRLKTLAGTVIPTTSPTPTPAPVTPPVSTVPVVAASPDTQAPTVPGTPRTSSLTPTSVTLTWSASTDATGVTGYKVYKNGSFLRQVTSTSASDTLTAGVSYMYSVSAIDAAGNESQKSSQRILYAPYSLGSSVKLISDVIDQSDGSIVIPKHAQGMVVSGPVTGSGSKNWVINFTGVDYNKACDSITCSGVHDVVFADYNDNDGYFPAISEAYLSGLSLDSQAPTAPTNLVGSAYSPYGIRLNWSPSTDNVGVSGYRINRKVFGQSSVYLGATGGSSFQDTKDLRPNTTYTYSIFSYDIQNNPSPTVSVSVTTPSAADTQPPAVSVTSPSGGTTVSGSAVSISANASDNTGVVGVQFKVDGVNMGSEDTVSPYTYTWSTVQYPNGSHTISAVARDSSGNLATAPAVGVNVNNTSNPSSPSASIITPLNGTVYGAVTIKANATDDVGIRSVAFRVDGVDVFSTSTPIFKYRYWDTNKNVANGSSHVLTVAATDTQGNVTVSSPVNVTVNNSTTSPGVTTSVTSFGGVESDYGFAVAVDSDGNKYVGGSVAARPYMVKSSASSDATLWSISPGSAGVVKAITVDKSNNDVYVAGFFYNTADFGAGPVNSVGGYDMFLAKYSSSGVLRWANRYGSSQGADFAGDESIDGMAIDNVGNVVIVGSYLDTVNFGTGPLTARGGKDAFIVKLNSSGVTLWSKTYGNSGTDDSASAVAIDANNNIYITGRFSVDVNLGGTTLVSQGSYDTVVAKFNSSGAHQWSKRAGGSGYDAGRGIALDPSNNPIIIGDYRMSARFCDPDDVNDPSRSLCTSYFTGMGEEDMFLVKYSGTNGVHMWSKSFGSWNTDRGQGITTNGNDVYVVGRAGGPMNFGGGTSTPPKNGYNAGLAKFNSSGAHQWSTIIGHGKEDVFAVATTNNAAYWVGRSASNPSIADEPISGADRQYTDFGNGYHVINYGFNLNPDIFLLKTTR